MSTIKVDLYGQSCPFFYRADVVRDVTSSYVAELGDTCVFAGYYTNKPNNITLSRFLILTKAGVLEDDPRITENGNGHVKVYLVDGIRCQQHLIYDSSQMYQGQRGISKEIIENREKEVKVLWQYIDEPSVDCEFVSFDGQDHFCLRSRWKKTIVDPSFLEPAYDLLYPEYKNGESSDRVWGAQDQDAELGINWLYGTYQSEQVYSKNAA